MPSNTGFTQHWPYQFIAPNEALTIRFSVPGLFWHLNQKETIILYRVNVLCLFP